MQGRLSSASATCQIQGMHANAPAIYFSLSLSLSLSLSMKINCHFLCSQCDELLKEKNDATKKCEELQKQLSALEISQKSDSEQMRNYQVHLITSKEIFI